MTLVLSALSSVLAIMFIAVLYKSKQLTAQIAVKEAELLRLDSEVRRMESEAAKRVKELKDKAEALIQEQATTFREESEKLRQHYEREAQRSGEEIRAMEKRLSELQKFEAWANEEEEARQVVENALKEAEALQREAHGLVDKARATGEEELRRAIERAKEIGKQAMAVLQQASKDAAQMIEVARARAEELGGEAFIALREKVEIEAALKAIHNTIDGYGDRYVVSTRSVLDDLAENYSHFAAGESLRVARERSRQMVIAGEAATCDYVESSRKDTAVRIVIDAFNGRADAILSRVRADNHGTLAQELRDAFSLVNLNGEAFRNARIRPEYLEARLNELKYAVIVQELRTKEREEQRRIQEQIREEERARKEFERAMREAQKEEDVIKRAMEKAQLLSEQASAEQKEKYERQLRELAEKLKAAEEKNQRAISMAQQTRRGHVYIVSNIGSFGENVYKIGLTRRLEPLDRVRELGDSSVPFDFDVHALIFSEDAPGLELQLHRHFLLQQVNKVNHRKEFFRIPISRVREELERLGISAKWTMAAAAADYRETLAIEKVIAEDPAKRDAWLNRQLQLEILEPLDAITEREAESSPGADLFKHRQIAPLEAPLESF